VYAGPMGIGVRRFIDFSARNEETT